MSFAKSNPTLKETGDFKMMLFWNSRSKWRRGEEMLRGAAALTPALCGHHSVRHGMLQTAAAILLTGDTNQALTASFIAQK